MNTTTVWPEEISRNILTLICFTLTCFPLFCELFILWRKRVAFGTRQTFSWNWKSILNILGHVVSYTSDKSKLLDQVWLAGKRGSNPRISTFIDEMEPLIIRARCMTSNYYWLTFALAKYAASDNTFELWKYGHVYTYKHEHVLLPSRHNSPISNSVSKGFD